jgi:LCP family protein required for cell wall assembly
VIDAIRTSENTSVVALHPRDPTIQAKLDETKAMLTGGKRAATPAGATPIASPVASPVASPIPEGNGTPVAVDAASITGVGDSGDQSSFDVVRELIQAGTSGDPSTSDVWGGRTDLFVLIAGIDRRPEGGDQNTDVIILAHVDLINQRVAAISIPRDLWVDIPGVGQDKINSAYNHGRLAAPNDPAAGISKLRDTIEAVFGVPIDGYILFDFNGFKTVVDELGGVDIDVPNMIVDTQYPTEDYGVKTVTFEPGEQHMNGERALEYVRTRHADSDDARRDRQVQVMLALFQKGKNLRSITKIQPLILALGKTVQTSFPLDQQLTFARLALETDKSNIRLTVLGADLLSGGPLYDGGPWVYTGDATQIAAYVQSSLSTDPAAFAEAAATPVP